MFVEFELRQGDPNADGTRTIRAYIGHNGKDYYSTKYAVKSSQWDKKRNMVREDVPDSQLWNGELTRLKREIEALCLKHPEVSAKQIKKLIGKKSIASFVSFFEDFIAKCESGGVKRTPGTVKNYQKVLNAIKAFPVVTDFNTIGKTWYEKYTQYLRKTNNENSVGGHIKIVKLILNEALEAGITTTLEHKKKYFKKPAEETDGIYLTEGEITLWTNADLNSFPALQFERDRFLISYYFLLRFGDSLRFSEADFKREGERVFLDIDSQKTKRKAIIPVKPAAYELLEKYGFKMPHTTNQEANWKLKEIGAIAKITDNVRLLGVEKPKNYFITTHTARRSGATNLYLQGVPDKIITDLGGWKKVEQMREYIKADKLDSAKRAMDFPFFK